MSNVEYFIGGGGDKNDWISGLSKPSNIVEAVSKIRKKTSFGIIVEYRGHEDEREIIEEIKKKWKSGEYSSIRLTGHSWGAQAAMDITQELFLAKIPVDELITLDPVSLFAFNKVYAGKWVNVYINPSILDSTIGKLPVIGNIINGILTLPTLLTRDGQGGGYIANVGGQLGAENGAHNVKIDVPHADAQTMYDKAREEILKAPSNPRVIGFK